MDCSVTFPNEDGLFTFSLSFSPASAHALQQIKTTTQRSDPNSYLSEAMSFQLLARFDIIFMFFNMFMLLY